MPQNFGDLPSHVKVEPGTVSKTRKIFAKLAIVSYKEIGHYFGHSTVGRTPLGGRRFKGSLFSGPLFFSRRELILFIPQI